MKQHVLDKTPHKTSNLLLGLLAIGCLGAALPVRAAPSAMDKIDHVVILYAENHSFDNLYGLFPGANGIANATPAQAEECLTAPQKEVLAKQLASLRTKLNPEDRKSVV